MTLAVLAGRGSLPQLLIDAGAILVRFDGAGCEATSEHEILARFERLGTLFEDLRSSGVDRLVFAGGMARPDLDARQFDFRTMALMPRVMAAMKGGDDGLLRVIVQLFEDQGFTVLGAHQVLPDLVSPQGWIVGTRPDRQAQQDAERGRAILDALGPVDVGQSCVVGQGLALGIETVQGTDALLDMVARTPVKLRRGGGGVLVKRAKPGQDLRIDMPVIGPGTVEAAVAAGLNGICIQADHVMIINRLEVESKVKSANMSLWAAP